MFNIEIVRSNTNSNFIKYIYNNNESDYIRRWMTVTKTIFYHRFVNNSTNGILLIKRKNNEQLY